MTHNIQTLLRDGPTARPSCGCSQVQAIETDTNSGASRLLLETEAAGDSYFLPRVKNNVRMDGNLHELRIFSRLL